jgi:hypothetical protein
VLERPKSAKVVSTQEKILNIKWWEGRRTYIWLEDHKVLFHRIAHVFLAPRLGQGKYDFVEYEAAQMIIKIC